MLIAELVKAPALKGVFPVSREVCLVFYLDSRGMLWDKIYADTDVMLD